MSLTLLDTNIVLRVIIHDISNADFNESVHLLQLGGVITNYVFPEVVFNFANQYLYNVAKEYAQSKGDSLLYSRDRRQYIRLHPQLREAGWHKKMYMSLQTAMTELLLQYPDVQMENHTLYIKAMDIAIKTGLDWVDCLLLAEHSTNGSTVQTLDKEMRKHLLASYKQTGPVTGMRLS